MKIAPRLDDHYPAMRTLLEVEIEELESGGIVVDSVTKKRFKIRRDSCGLPHCICGDLVAEVIEE